MFERRYCKVVNLPSIVGEEAIPLSCASQRRGWRPRGMMQRLVNGMPGYAIKVNAVCPRVVGKPLWEPLHGHLSANEGITRDEA
jgi:hypothetical protein